MLLENRVEWLIDVESRIVRSQILSTAKDDHLTNQTIKITEKMHYSSSSSSTLLDLITWANHLADFFAFRS